MTDRQLSGGRTDSERSGGLTDSERSGGLTGGPTNNSIQHNKSSRKHRIARLVCGINVQPNVRMAIL